jgi:hypothetical protein
METLPHTPDTPPHDGSPREVPQFALDFAASLKQRRTGEDGPYPGASAAERHRLEAGHALEAGCCARAQPGDGDDSE